MILITSANLRWSKRRSKARSASGGIVYGGEADGSTSDVLQRSASGGIVFGGSASGVIKFVERSASGGIVYGGSAELSFSIVDPTDLVGLGAWYDATSVSGSTVNDLSGSGRNLVKGANGTLSTGAHDGIDCITIMTQSLASAEVALASDNIASDVAGFTVIALTTSGSSGVVFGFGNEPIITYTSVAFPAQNSFGFRPAQSESTRGLSPTVASRPWLLHHRIDYQAGTHDYAAGSLSGSAAITGGSNSDAALKSLLMRVNGTSAASAQIRIAEVIAYNRALSTAEIEAVKAYLQSKHSL